MSWQPSDDALDAVARGTPAGERGTERVEEGRTSLLARAALVAQHPRATRAPVIAAVMAVVAAAAIALVWIGTRSAAPHASKSGRAGEAAALLSWLLYEAGQLDAAEQRFHEAVTDRVPKVRDSATTGLEAIKRARKR